MKSTFMDKAWRNLFFRSFLAPTVAARWILFIRNFHRDVGAREPVARVLAKPLRSYLFKGLPARRRLEALLEHYRLLGSLFRRDFISRLCSGEAIPMIELKGKKNSNYLIYVTPSVVATMQREGELAIFIAKSEDSQKLCRLSLILTTIEGDISILIGGIQGPLSLYKREVIDATRDLHGLRPKDAVFLATRSLARSLGIKRIHTVSDNNHILGRLQDKSKFSNYDDYWRERGGIAAGPYGFQFESLTPMNKVDNNRDIVKTSIIEGIDAFVKKNTFTD